MSQNSDTINKNRVWRIFMVNVSLIIVLFLAGIFIAFVLRTNQIISNQIITTARSNFKNIVLTRRWNADYGGVFVKKIKGMISNPYLENPDIVTTDGRVYTKKNPSLMTREISEYAKMDGDFTYHLTSLRPLNPDNAPDDFEKNALQLFETGIWESSVLEISNRKTIFRYMAPLLVEKGCLDCHAKQGYSIGEVRGGISVSFDISEIKKDMAINKILVAVLSIITIFTLLTVIISMVLRLAKKLKVAYQIIEQMAITDELTQIYNRRYFHTRLDQEVSRSKRYDHPLSLMMLDIDHFKRVNDVYGHQIGDDVLAGLAAIIKSTTRKMDVVVRYGGEEIAVILPETDGSGAVLNAEKIRHNIEKHVFEVLNGKILQVTVSVGVSCLDQIANNEEDKAKKLIKIADDALYQAKKSGRNQVVKE
ncbi:MAG: diguanylate cyclase [Desulfobacula sp.]|nr:diguanylate cyclase [Desulfobacula sp.]